MVKIAREKICIGESSPTIHLTDNVECRKNIIYISGIATS
jgi:hypothetical protein